MDFQTLGLLSAAVLFLVGLAFTLFGEHCNDYMFRYFGYSFFGYAAARTVHVMFPFDHSVGHVHVNEIFVGLVMGLSSVILVVGALNGSRRRKETPYVMFAAIVVSILIGSFSDVSAFSSLMPLAVGVAFGDLAAGVILVQRNMQDQGCQFWHRALGLLFIAKSFISVMWPYALYDGLRPFGTEILVWSIVITAAMLGVMAPLSSCRIKFKNTCTEKE